MQPVRASSEYTVPFWLPTNTRPPATLGCAHADEASGNPNAHLSAKRGTCSAVRPACAADWKRAFVIVGPHPFHIGPDEEIRNGDAAVQRPAAAPVTSPPSVFAGDVLCDRPPLGAAQPGALHPHRAADQALENRCR